MALYLGSDKVKVNLNGAVYCLNLFSSVLILNGIKLLSSDDYILKDSNGLYIVPKVHTLSLLSLDDYMLKDVNGLYLTTEEEN